MAFFVEYIQCRVYVIQSWLQLDQVLCKPMLASLARVDNPGMYGNGI